MSYSDSLLAASKAKNWVQITNGDLISQDDLAGIIVKTGGTLVLIGSNGISELDCGTVVSDLLTVLPFCPSKIKSTSTAVIVAVYGA